MKLVESSVKGIFAGLHIEPKKEYSVYYRTGGTENFNWQKTFITYTREEAIKEVERLEAMGFPARYAKTELLNAIGLPDNY